MLRWSPLTDLRLGCSLQGVQFFIDFFISCFMLPTQAQVTDPSPTRMDTSMYHDPGGSNMCRALQSYHIYSFAWCVYQTTADWMHRTVHDKCGHYWPYVGECTSLESTNDSSPDLLWSSKCIYARDTEKYGWYQIFKLLYQFIVAYLRYIHGAHLILLIEPMHVIPAHTQSRDMGIIQ